MQWNLENIRFLYPPDDFTGAFNNEKMQARHKAMQDKKINDILEKLENEVNPERAMDVLNPKEYVSFLLNNIKSFQSATLFEKTVLRLYYRRNTPFVGTDDYPTWEKLLGLCDKVALRNLGPQLPKKIITAYRGSVTGVSKGLSWTISREKADWFLDRWRDKDMGGGTVFSIEISEKDILVYLDDKDKQEVILRPEVVATLQPVIVESI